MVASPCRIRAMRSCCPASWTCHIGPAARRRTCGASALSCGRLTPVPRGGRRASGGSMRPKLTVLDDDLIGRILDEAKRVLAEVGMEIRGPEMRQRLLDHGLPLDAERRAGPVPARRRRAGHRDRPEAVHRCTTATATRTPTSAATGSTSCRARRGLKVARPPDRRGPPRELDRLRRVRPARDGLAATSPTSRRPSRPTPTSRRRSPTPGASTWSSPTRRSRSSRAPSRSTASRGWSR